MRKRLFACLSPSRLGHLTSHQTRIRRVLSTVALVCAFSLFAHLALAQGTAANAGRTYKRHSIARPKASPGGSQPGIASFLGNFTTINDPSQAMMLVRGADCTLSLIDGSFSARSGLTYKGSGVIGSYELVLHNEAGLTTTPDVFASGCAAPATGFESATAAFVGTTANGINVIAVVGYSPITQVNAIYLVSGTDVSTYTLNTFSLASAGLINTADLNKDGNGDIVVLNSTLTTAGSITVLLGNPDGSFQTGVTYPTAGSGAQSAVIDDFNGDGKLDIAVVSAYGTSSGAPAPQQISILLGNGDGTFQTAQNFTIPTLPGYNNAGQTLVNNIISASLRGNGKKDLILSNGLVYLGNGDGTFAANPTQPLPFFTDYVSAGPYLASGDVNNDGKTDVVLSNGGSVHVFLGNGDGTFKTGNSYDSISGLYSAGYVTISDLDGDGNPDIYVGIANGGLYLGDSYSFNQAYALMGNGDGTFQGASQAVDSGTYTGNNLGDVNGDGQPDLITNIPNSFYSAATASFSVQLGTPKGFFNPASTITAPSTFTLNGISFTSAGTTATYAVADINGDGKADLVFVNTGLTALNASNNNMPYGYAYPVLFVALSNGDGTFQTPVPYAFPQLAPAGDFDNTLTVSNLQIADFNKDGHNDLILTYNDLEGASFGGPPVNSYNHGFVVFLGNGDGTFGTAPILTSTYTSNTSDDGSQPYVSSTVDLNGDGIPDLVALSPTFTITNGTGVSTVQLVTYIGNGDGTFKTPVVFPSASNLISPVVADFNKDGKLDVAFINAVDEVSQGQLEIALGNGDGTFGTPVTNLSIFSGASLAAADFNGDGNLDVALLGEISGIFYGNGDGTLTSIDSSGTYGPIDLINIGTGEPAVAVDLNKDGKPDILAGGTSLLNRYSSVPPFVVLSDLTPTTISVAASASTVSAGTSVTLTGTITPGSGATAAPSGSVTFLNADASLGAATVASNKATFTTTALAAGTYNILAIYEGDANFDGNLSAPVTLTITPSTAVATTTTLTSSATSAASGTSITFTATVAQASGTTTPTGTVSFLDGTTALGTGTLAAGVATFTTSTLAVGTHSIIASYAGVSGAFNASASTPAISVTITAPVTPGFTISLSSATASVSPGSTATTTLSVTPSGGFSAATALTCSGAVTYTTCTIAPISVTPSGTTASTATVTLATTAQASLRRPANTNSSNRGSFLAALPAGILLSTLLFGLRRRTLRSRTLQFLAFASVSLLLAATGCGGKAASTTSPLAAQTDTLTITATSGSIVQSTTWTVSILP